jgi:hypothetical protein
LNRARDMRAVMRAEQFDHLLQVIAREAAGDLRTARPAREAVRRQTADADDRRVQMTRRAFCCSIGTRRHHAETG